MKSKELKIYHVPNEFPPLLTMTIKPRRFLFFALWISVFVFCFLKPYSVVGLVGSAICLFALVVMPDRNLISIYESMLVVYDSHQKDTCFCIYWEELLSWQYVRGIETDSLKIELIDGQIVETDIYKDNQMFRYLNMFAKGKEKKQSRKRGKMI